MSATLPEDKPTSSILTYYEDVVILTAMGEEAAVEAKEAPRQG